MHSVYFEVDGRKIDNRRNAEIYKRDFSPNSSINFISGPTLDFSIPYVSLRDAVKNRCIQLREQYSWLQLFYSGGADSHTILESFIHNDIPVNEIVMSRWTCDNSWEHLHNIEINQTAMRVLKKYQSYFFKHKVKITHCDFNAALINKLYTDYDFLRKCNCVSFSNPGTIYHMVYAYPDLLEHDSLCQIVGWEKPSVRITDGVIKTFSIDKTTPFIPDSSLNTKFEFFYMEDPLLSVTQYRVAKEIINKFMSTADGIIANSNQTFFGLLNKYARFSEECDISNTLMIGKSFDAEFAYKEKIMLDHMRIHLPETWESLTKFYGSTDYSDIINFSDVAPDNDWRKLTGLIGDEQEIL